MTFSDYFLVLIGLIVGAINHKIFKSAYILKNGSKLDVPLGMLKRGSSKYYIFSTIISFLYILLCSSFNELDYSIVIIIISIILGILNGKSKA